MLAREVLSAPHSGIRPLPLLHTCQLSAPGALAREKTVSRKSFLYNRFKRSLFEAIADAPFFAATVPSSKALRMGDRQTFKQGNLSEVDFT